MLIRSTYNGGLADVDDESAARLIEGGSWVAEGDYVPPAAEKPKRIRRTKAQIEADNAKAAAAYAAAQENQNEE
ncbi:hypothetical protein MycrhDRAFT_6898 [Mycolicibacterium rhodesiae JS60]|nr:hypothetical protein MycrhDRAFT_6898 [Mycolicibacterium rhodesiae JS60]